MTTKLQKKDFFKLIRHRNLKGLTELLDKHPDLVNKKTLSGYSALEIGLFSLGKDDSIIRLLIERGCNVNETQKKDNNIPLAFILVRQDKAELLKLMIDHNLSLNVKNNNGYSLLEIAFFCQSTKCVELLKKYLNTNQDLFIILDKGDNESFINQFNHLKNTEVTLQNFLNKGNYYILERAVTLENKEIIKFLLEQPEIDINYIKKRYNTNLSNNLCLNGNEDILRLFIEKGFKYNHVLRGHNTLYFAVMNQNMEAVKILLEHNCIIEYDHNDSNIISTVYKTLNHEMITLIYEHYLQQIKLNISFNKTCINSPAFYFFSQGNSTAFEIHREKYFKHSEKDIKKNTYLHYAMQNGVMKYIEEFMGLEDISKHQHEVNKRGYRPVDMLLICSKVNSTKIKILDSFEEKGGFTAYYSALTGKNVFEKMSLIDKFSISFNVDIVKYLMNKNHISKVNPQQMLFDILINYETYYDFNDRNNNRYVTENNRYYLPPRWKKTSNKQTIDKDKFIEFLFKDILDYVDFKLPLPKEEKVKKRKNPIKKDLFFPEHVKTFRDALFFLNPKLLSDIDYSFLVREQAKFKTSQPTSKRKRL